MQKKNYNLSIVSYPTAVMENAVHGVRTPYSKN